MAIKFELKKDAYVKKGFVGFSFTSYLWDFFVPMLRGDGKGFFILLGIQIVTAGPIYLIYYFIHNWNLNSIFIKIFIFLFNIEHKYIFIGLVIFLVLLSIISIFIRLFIGNWYNKYYTMRLLNKGYSPLENDDYALALLKEYGYLEYSEDEKKDREKMELYKNIVETAKKDEKTKFYIFLIFFVIDNIISLIGLYGKIIEVLT